MALLESPASGAPAVYIPDGPAPRGMLLCEIESPEVLETEAYIQFSNAAVPGRTRPLLGTQTTNLYEMIFPDLGRDKPAGDTRSIPVVRHDGARARLGRRLHRLV